MPAVGVRAAQPDDVPLLHALVCELAEYERLRDAVRACEDDLRRALFGPRPFCEALVGELAGASAGFALFFHNYSTFVGRPGLYLEDLYVCPAARGFGLGKALLARVVQLAHERGCGRVEWTALDWNEPAIRFYRSLGARQMSDWRLFRLDGPALEKLANLSPER